MVGWYGGYSTQFVLAIIHEVGIRFDISTIMRDFQNLSNRLWNFLTGYGCNKPLLKHISTICGEEIYQMYFNPTVGERF